MSAQYDEHARRPGFFATTVARPVGLLVSFLTLILIGLIAYSRIPLQMLPSGISGTRLTVWIDHPGSSAQENEEKVARVIEEQFETLPGLSDVYSSSGENSVRLSVRFNGNADMDFAKAELRDRIERARPMLPDSVSRIYVWANDDGDPPIMFFAILVDERSDDMDWLIENRVQRKIEAADGVSRVSVFGLLNDSVRILLDEERIKAQRVNIGELIQRLRKDNFAEPLGEVTDGGRRFLLRSDMRFGSFEEIGEYPIGGGLRLSDVAHVERVKTVRDRLARIDGRDAYYGMIQKESTANVVETSRNIKAVTDTFADDPQIAGRVSLTPLFDQAEFIGLSLDRLKGTALWGGGLAVLVLFLFLRRARMTLCVALSIPTAALLSITWEYFSGGTFNVLTMTGLTLGLGMLVDNSVVVIENIARLRSRGMESKAAAVAGVRDVGLAISLATLTSVVVFLPLIFMGDDPTMRLMLAALGIPLCASLLFSLFVALVFLPVISARILTGRPRFMERLAAAVSPVVAVPVRLLALLIGAVRIATHWTFLVAHRLERVALACLTPLRWPIAAGCIVAAVWLTGTSTPMAEMNTGLERMGLRGTSVGSAAFSARAGGFMLVLAALLAAFGLPRWRRRAALPPERPTQLVPTGSSPLAWMQDANRALLRWTLKHRLLATSLAILTSLTAMFPMGNMTMTAFGQDEDRSEVEVDIDPEDNFTLYETSQEFRRYEELLESYREELGYAHLVARFGAGGGEIGLRWAERQDPEFLKKVRERLRRELPRWPGHRLRFSREQQIDSTTRQYIGFQLRGPNAEALEKYGEEAVKILEQVPGLTDVQSPLETAPEQVRLVFDNEAAYSFGVTSDIALQNISWALRGAQLSRYQEAGREVPLIIEYDEEAVAGLDTLKDLEIWTGESTVPLAAFSEIEFQKGRRQIRRYNGQTTYNIQARLDDPNRMAALVTSGYDALEAGLELPRGFSLGRDQSALARTRAQMVEMQRALLLSIVLVFLLMGILFESLLLPFSVLTTIPFAVVGALWTLYVTGTAMDSVGWIGIIILVGVVVNNGIVLIDKIHRLRVEGVPRERAVLDGARARVRPILMTALTTIFGLLPMALGEAAREGIDYRALATCVAGGLSVSTFFTLWVVPLAYTVMDDLAGKIGWLLRRVLNRGPLEAGGAAAAAGALPLRAPAEE